ncbi:MAG: DUF5107 domain-containing protein [Longimicrobiales bacterium]
MFWLFATRPTGLSSGSFRRNPATILALTALLLSPGEAAPQAEKVESGVRPPGIGGPSLGSRIQSTPPAARISEEIRSLQTYPFSEPNAVPMLVRDRRLYPYHSFEGYSATSEPGEWTVVTLENDYLQVFVLPEVGGKVWGAVVKETGHEFIYRNEVMKFRNIALRGPWTSGGIEFNFGIIGHTPSTATPVDYLLRENPDGSVSCIVGAMDLPSRTHWRVEIRLPSDRAYFETRVLWYNPTPLEQPYYNWMTAAAFAREDLVMSMPGTAYLRHSGQRENWPVDEAGRYLPTYAENTFGGHKSYHVVGELKDFFGGYYQDGDFGFGHWARYEEMPGQKLWLWALSREGGVWEDLLTDTDGQYVEFQAGRLFVQYSPGAEENPITQAAFDPMSASRWTEAWFPLEGIGGLSDASRDGALYVSLEGSRLTVGVNAFGAVADTLRVWSGERIVTLTPVELTALEPYRTTVEITPGLPYRVTLPELDLDYRSDPGDRVLARPFATDPAAWSTVPEATRLVFQARELMKGREYGPARELLDAAIAGEPWNRGALLGLAALDLRAGIPDRGLERVNRALQLDAYDAEANFLAGNLYRALQRPADARDAFGWAARSTAYRSAAYAQLAEILLGLGEWSESARYARLAIDFDRYSVPAWQALALIGRNTGDGRMAMEARDRLFAIDPLHHFVRAEEYLADHRRGISSAGGRGAESGDPTPLTGMDRRSKSLTGSLGGEYPEQTLLELAIHYANLGLREDALALLELAETATSESFVTPGGPELVLRAWRAWLGQDPAALAGPTEPAFAFPYRTESLPVFEWAARYGDHWVWRYLLSLNLWALDREAEAAPLMEALQEEPDFGPFYVARAQLLSQTRGVDPGADLRRAVVLDPGNRILHLHLIRHLQEAADWEGGLEALAEAKKRFPGDFNLDLLHARALIHVGRALEAAEILGSTRVLPSENARESHRLYEQAHTLAALDALEAGEREAARGHLRAALRWPESLGQGRPYEPEERVVRFLLARLDGLEGNEAGATAEYSAVLDGTTSFTATPTQRDPAEPVSRLDLLALPSLHALGRTVQLEALGRYTSTATEVGQFAGRLAGALAWGSEPPGEAVRRLAPEFPFLFADLDGRMLLRALTTSASPGPGTGKEGGSHR